MNPKSAKKIRSSLVIVVTIILVSTQIDLIDSTQNESSIRSSVNVAKMKSLLTKLVGRALSIDTAVVDTVRDRNAKWNEFIEEQNLKASKSNPSLQQPGSTGATPVPSTIPPLNVLLNIEGTKRTTTNKSLLNQSLIDETKDPDSPYYIAMISSNIGESSTRFQQQKQHPTNRTVLLDRSQSSSSSSQQYNQSTTTSTFISKLFNYAFQSTAPPLRTIMLAPNQRPLVTYINVSTLENYDDNDDVAGDDDQHQDVWNVQNKTPGEQFQSLSLLNSADPSGTSIMQPSSGKKRLPECAQQQVCSAHYVKSNHTQRLCNCPAETEWNCEDPDPNEEHIIDLSRKQDFKTKRNSLETYTQVKLCENLNNMKPCKTPTDWTIMALQSERTGKAHFVVVCKCPDSASFEGPFTHKHPPYARFPGIRVYGMLCNQGIRKSKYQQHALTKALEIDLERLGNDFPEFPWELAYAVINSTATQGFW